MLARKAIALAAVVALFVGCSAASPSRSGPTSQGAAAASRSTRAATPSPTPSPTRTPGFVPTGSMSTGRGDFTATRLLDGRVLVAGGNEPVTKAAIATAEIYDPATGKFAPTGSMRTPRSGPTATLLRDGRVLIVGGLTGPSDSIDPVGPAELFDPASGKFTGTGSLVTARDSHTATLLLDGRVLIAGGFDLQAHRLASAEIYDPATGRFIATGSLKTARGFHTATLLESGRVFIEGGGVQLPLDDKVESMPAELYDPSTGQFSVVGGDQPTRGAHTSTLLSDGRVLVTAGLLGGGVDTVLISFVYDPTSSSFTPVTVLDWPGAPATLLNDGRVLLCGGFGPPVIGSQVFEAKADAGLFVPDDGSWVPVGSMSTGRAGAWATLLLDGRVLVVGGVGGEAVEPGSAFGTQFASAELYQP